MQITTKTSQLSQFNYIILVFIRLSLIILVFLCVDSARAADTLRLTLDDCIRMALGNSPTVQVARFDSLSAAGEWRRSRSERFPQLRFSGEAPDLSEGEDYRTIQSLVDSEKDSLIHISSGDQRWQGRLELEQKLPWGATLSISSGLSTNTWHDDRISAGKDITEYSLRRRFSVVQPILAGNPVGRTRKIERIGWESSLIDHELQLKSIKYRAKQVYFQLVSATGALNIALQDLENGRSSEELARRKLQAGLIPEVELLQIQVDLARREGNYYLAEGRVQAAADRLKQELGLSLNLPIVVEWLPETVTGSERALLDTTGERLEQKREQLNLHRREMETRGALLYQRVQASLQLYYDLENRHDKLDLLDTPVDHDYGIIFHFDFPLYGFGSTAGQVESIRANLARARVKYIISETELATELREALRSVKRAEQRIRIADAALELSQKSFEITSNRFDAGQINSRQLLDTQLDLTRTRTDLLNARIDYELALADLERIVPQ